MKSFTKFLNEIAIASPENRFAIGDKVRINDRAEDYNGEIMYVAGFEKNMFGRLLVQVSRSKGGPESTVFYPYELDKV